MEPLFLGSLFEIWRVNQWLLIDFVTWDIATSDLVRMVFQDLIEIKLSIRSKVILKYWLIGVSYLSETLKKKL